MRLYPPLCSYALGGKQTHPIHFLPLEIRAAAIIRGIEKNVDMMHQFKNKRLIPIWADYDRKEK